MCLFRWLVIGMFVLHYAIAAEGAVSGVVEDFSGGGEYAGLHYDFVFTGGPQLQNGEWEWDVREGARGFRANLVGKGSFRTVVQFSAFDLGELGDVGRAFSAASTFSVNHLAGEASGGIRAKVAELPFEEWRLAFKDHVMEVPSSENGVRFELEYDTSSQLGIVRYDRDTSDSIESVSVGPFLDEFEMKEEHPVLVVFDVSFDDPEELPLPYIRAAIDYFMILPLDASLGDYSGNGVLGSDDIDMLIRASRLSTEETFFDLSSDGQVDFDDIENWVHSVKNTYFGDVNLDGEFASSDLVLAFGAGEYEDDVPMNSTWSKGDWNGDGDFTSSDLVLAFQDGGYEQGPRTAVVVPEPGALSLLGAVGVVPFLRRRK